MLNLRDKLEHTDRFLVGCELVSVRGSMAQGSAVKARDFGAQLAASAAVDWVSITDNAGGNPQLAPAALGKPILYAGKEVVIHLTCKDLNRNGLESAAWLLHSEGFRNVLAMTGDYPTAGNGGMAKPVFDIDSVGLISLLAQMNRGLAPTRPGAGATLEPTDFLVGAVTSNSKLLEGEVMPQYAKLAAKVRAGARFIINQVSYDARKAHELRLYMDEHGMAAVPLIGNVYVLNPRVARMFHDRRIPGIAVSAELLRLAEEHGQSQDRGRSFFEELAAKQIAIYRGLGFRGAYLGGVHSLGAVDRVLERERRFAADDWREFAREISFSRPSEFCFYAQDPATGLADPSRRDPGPHTARSGHAGGLYRLSKWTHHALFAPGTPISRLGAKLAARAADPMQGPRPLRLLEHASKSVLYHCRDCGDCSLPETGYLCPESQCAKNQRNGPCGGTRDGRCEVAGYGDCIWLRAYERRKHDGTEAQLLDHVPVVQDQGLRGTSSWANTWLGRDHYGRPAAPLPEPATGAAPVAAPGSTGGAPPGEAPAAPDTPENPGRPRTHVRP